MNSEIILYLLLFFFLSPFVIRYSSSVMSESLAIAFIMGFFYYYVQFIENNNHQHLLLVVAFGCAAINTRFVSFIVLLIPGIHATYLFFSNFRVKSLFFIILILIISFFPGYYLHLYQAGSITAQPHFIHWSLLNYFRNSFTTSDGLLSYRFPNLAYVFSILAWPGFIFAGGLFLIFFRFKTVRSLFMIIVAATILLYALFLAGLTFQNDRVLILAFPCVLLLFSGTYLEMASRLKNWKAAWYKIIVVLVIIIQLGLFYRAFRPFYENNRVIITVVDRIRNYPDRQVYTFDIDMALKAYGIRNEIINLWDNQLPDFKPGSLVLFNYLHSQEQWKGMNPMLNWEEMNRSHHLKILENLPDGWNLYEIAD